MTRKLYRENPYMKEFEARVAGTGSTGDECYVTLDETAFYPESGGQPFDTGTLGEVRVHKVVERGDEVRHYVDAVRVETGEIVRGAIDWTRRYDHMQQHTGQHILSAVMDRLYRFRTISFHLGSETSTIDLAVDFLNDEQIKLVEDEVNEITWKAVPVVHNAVDSHDIKNRKLRKETSRTGEILLVEISGVDLIACGGTHVTKTSEAGPIKIVHQEKMRGNARIHFVSGGRALQDYRSKDRIIRSMASKLSINWNELETNFDNKIEDIKVLKLRLRKLEEIEQEHEIMKLKASAEKVRDCDIVIKIYQDISIDNLRKIAVKLMNLGQTVSLLASRNQKALLVFSVSPTIKPALDMRELIQTACGVIGGNGGGKPEFAQGGGTDVASLDQAMEHARKLVIQKLEQS